jgi:hypothetical protein
MEEFAIYPNRFSPSWNLYVIFISDDKTAILETLSREDSKRIKLLFQKF